DKSPARPDHRPPRRHGRCPRWCSGGGLLMTRWRFWRLGRWLHGPRHGVVRGEDEGTTPASQLMIVPRSLVSSSSLGWSRALAPPVISESSREIWRTRHARARLSVTPSCRRWFVRTVDPLSGSRFTEPVRWSSRTYPEPHVDGQALDR